MDVKILNYDMAIKRTLLFKIRIRQLKLLGASIRKEGKRYKRRQRATCANGWQNGGCEPWQRETRKKLLRTTRDRNADADAANRRS